MQVIFVPLGPQSGASEMTPALSVQPHPLCHRTALNWRMRPYKSCIDLAHLLKLALVQCSSVDNYSLVHTILYPIDI